MTIIDVKEVRAVLYELSGKSAAGPDRITKINKALRNLKDEATEKMAKYKCWKSGTLPKQWKTARAILIPKPGKPLSTDNLQPISLTPCVGKVLKRVLMNRWQDYLEQSGLYPASVIVLRQHLSTHDVMVLLTRPSTINNVKREDNKAILGLDLQSAFDKVKHSPILSQVSRLSIGERSYNYIRDFPTGRTAELRAGDLQLQEMRLGSMGTPQGSVISLLLFNLVMIGVAERLEKIEGVRHTIYADDIMLWLQEGSDTHIKGKLQEAVYAIEDQLNGSGLICSPSKSELLVLPPRRVNLSKYKPRMYEEIKVVTRSGRVIPEVGKIRALGTVVEKQRRNGEAVARLTAKVANVMRLIKRVANRKAGIRKESSGSSNPSR